MMATGGGVETNIFSRPTCDFLKSLEDIKCTALKLASAAILNVVKVLEFYT